MKAIKTVKYDDMDCDMDYDMNDDVNGDMNDDVNGDMNDDVNGDMNDKDEKNLSPQFYNKFKHDISSNDLSKFRISHTELEQILNDRCYLCDSAMKQRNAVLHLLKNADYITPDHVRFACNFCNRMKSDKDSEILFKKCESICAHTFKSNGAIFYNNVFENNYNCERYNYVKKRSEKTNYVFELTEADYINLICGNCCYCGRASSNVHVNGVIMQDTDKGYTVDNCLTCCKDCEQLRANMKHVKFLNHIKKIYEYNDTTRQTKKISIINDMRLYVYYGNNKGIMTDIVFPNMHKSDNWTHTYNYNLSSNNVFFTLEDKNEFDDDHDNVNVIVEEISIDSSIHKMSYIGLSQSNNSTIDMKYLEIDTLTDVDQIMKNLTQNRNNIVQKCSDIILNIPHCQNNITVYVTKKNNYIIRISFKIYNDHKICNCVVCSEHNQNKKCLCDNCMKHMTHNTTSCVYCDLHVKHTKPIIIGSDEQINTYTNKYYKLANLSFDEKLDFVKQINNIITAELKNQYANRIGIDKFNKKNAMITKKSETKKKELMGQENYKLTKSEYMKKYRSEKKKEKPEKIGKTDEQKKDDATTRKQKQRIAMKEKYGEDTYKRITCLESKLSKAKKSGKPDAYLKEIVDELIVLKNV